MSYRAIFCSKIQKYFKIAMLEMYTIHNFMRNCILYKNFMRNYKLYFTKILLLKKGLRGKQFSKFRHEFFTNCINLFELCGISLSVYQNI